MNQNTALFDDFGLFMNERPGCMFLLGCGVNTDDVDKNEEILSKYSQNSSRFRLDERSLTIGAQIMVTLVLERLVNWKKTQTPVANDVP